MDEGRRLAYLRAMGVALWVPRGGRSPPAATGAELAPALGELPEPARPAGDPPGPDTPERVPLSPHDEIPVATVAASARALVDAPAERAAGLATDVSRSDWAELESEVAGCRACGLCETRTHTVFGVGDRQAGLMVIGEAPGADEDREGEPFVGRAGQLLNRMLAAIGLPRERVYIANILKCRPPGNRDPRPEEALRCEGFLMRQIALVQPRAILSVGRISAQGLLRTDAPVGRLRGRWHAFGPAGTPLRVTYHPAYLLRSPDQKAKAWEDLCAVARRLAGHE